MKRIFTVLALLTILASCSTTEDEAPNLTPKNDLVDTLWEGANEAHDKIYGGENVRQFEFYSETQVRDMMVKNGKVWDTFEGTYSRKDSTITVDYGGGNKNTFTRRGSLLISPTVNDAGDFVTYKRIK